MRHRLLISVATVVALAALFAWPRLAQAQDDADQQVRQEARLLFQAIEKRKDLQRCWNYVLQLQDLARRKEDALKAVCKQHETHANERVRLAVARLYGATYKDDVGASTIVLRLLQQSSDSAVLHAAAELMLRHGLQDEEQIEAVSDLIKSRAHQLTGRAKVAMLRLKAQIDETPDAALAELADLTKSQDAAVRSEALLALAEQKPNKDLIDRVKQLGSNPSIVGQLARAIVKNDSIKDDIVRESKLVENKMTAVKGLPDYSDKNFFWALTLTVHRFVTVRERETGTKERGDYRLWTVNDLLAPRQLLDEACRGMAAHVDSYSVYMTGKEMEEMTKDMQGRYGGVGAFVTTENGVVTITQPIYEYIKEDPPGSRQFRVVKGPAYAAGLRSGDQIIGGNGKDFKGWSLEDVIKELKGEEGTKVSVKVMRRGWKEPRVFELERAMIEISTAQHELLPGRIGYINLKQFGYNTGLDLEKALQALERQGMRGLVIDLRENPGGALTAVLEVADKFLTNRRMLAYVQGRWGRWREREEYYDEDKVPPRDLPLAILISKDSASGSELFSGCMQDHKRAVLIGETTFGKGVGQGFFYINASTGGADEKDPAFRGFTRWLRLTTFAYYLPGGRNINGVGVSPDIPMDTKLHFKGVHYSCDYLSWEGWKLAEIDRLMNQRDENGLDPIRRYVEQYVVGNEDAFLKLADFDDFQTAAYPGFDAWYASLKTTLSSQDCRRLLRMGRGGLRTGGIRLACADHRGRDYIQNFQDDRVLQRGITEVAKALKLDLNEVPQFRHFAGLWK